MKGVVPRAQVRGPGLGGSRHQPYKATLRFGKGSSTYSIICLAWPETLTSYLNRTLGVFRRLKPFDFLPYLTLLLSIFRRYLHLRLVGAVGQPESATATLFLLLLSPVPKYGRYFSLAVMDLW